MQFSGMMAPVFAPFNKDESLNYNIIPAYAKYLKEHGVNGIYVNGTVGEGVSLTTEEREKLTEKWMISVKEHNMTAIIMIGGLCLHDVKRLARHAENHGAQGIAVLPSLFYKPINVDDLISYCSEVAAAAPKTSLFYYHIPFMTGVTISMEDFLRRGKLQIPTLCGMKFTHEDISGEGYKCLTVSNKELLIFSGLDQKTAEALELGYVAAINCCFNFIPELAGRIFQASSSKDEDKEWLNKATQLQDKVNTILNTIFSFTNGFSVASVKSAMRILTDIDVGHPRKPLKSLTTSEELEMKSKLSDCMKSC